MKAGQKIKKYIIWQYLNTDDEYWQESINEVCQKFNLDRKLKGADIDENNVDLIYESLDDVYDIIYDLRGGEVETDISPETSRHYESKSVAAKMDDGSWVGWTYWYGGGKHAEPEAIDWIDDAYNLECVGEKVIKKLIFKKVK